MSSTGYFDAVMRRLEGWAAEFARVRGIPNGALPIEPPLHEDEAAGMAVALGASLVRVEPDGMFRVAGARRGKGPYNLFSRGPTPSLNREYLIQLTAFAELVVEHRWPARQVAFEYDALDLAVLDGDKPLVVAEAKRDRPSLERMLAQFEAATPEHVVAPANTVQRKVAALARLRPAAFWAVAPGVRQAFSVELDPSGVPRFRPHDGLPQGPRTELNCPICGSKEDVRGSPLPDGRIGLVCTACDHRWSRTSRRPCRRCGSADVEAGGYRGWAYEDSENATDDTMAPWHYVDWDVYRCRKCHHTWKVGRRAE